MATYLELYDLRQDTNLRAKVTVAVAVKAQTIIDLSSPTSEQITWASDALDNPSQKAVEILNYVLAVNKAITVPAIQGAADTVIQGNVNDAVDALITGGA